MPELITKLISKKKKVGAYPIEEYWLAIENLEDVEQALSCIEQWKHGD